MMKPALGALLVGLMACGGGGGSNSTVVIQPDGSGGGDSGPGVCNPLTQTGCNAGEKCTWISDQDDPPIGHVGCAPEAAAPKQIDEVCTDPPAGPMGYDDCAKGSVCLAGVCKQICDVNGGDPTCDTNHSCTRYADFFEVGGNAVAGVCDPGCDPLTQELKVGTNKTACGSPTATAPNSGCYGYSDYSCAPVGPTTLELLDRDPPRTSPSGNPYLNGCAPGFIPFFYEMTGSTTTVCSGFCSALEVDNTPAKAAGDIGNAAALGKMPTEAAPVAGSSICSGAKKGTTMGGQSSSCQFLWPYVQEDDGSFLAGFDQSIYLDTLGICMFTPAYNYDDDMNTQTPNVPYPKCASLPPRSASTTGDSDDAVDWGCYKLANSMFAASDKPDMATAKKMVRLPKNAPMELVRHSFH
jgi:hypothetical protein